MLYGLRTGDYVKVISIIAASLCALLDILEKQLYIAPNNGNVIATLLLQYAPLSRDGWPCWSTDLLYQGITSTDNTAAEEGPCEIVSAF